MRSDESVQKDPAGRSRVDAGSGVRLGADARACATADRTKLRRLRVSRGPAPSSRRRGELLVSSCSKIAPRAGRYRPRTRCSRTRGVRRAPRLRPIAGYAAGKAMRAGTNRPRVATGFIGAQMAGPRIHPGGLGQGGDGGSRRPRRRRRRSAHREGRPSRGTPWWIPARRRTRGTGFAAGAAAGFAGGGVARSSSPEG